MHLHLFLLLVTVIGLQSNGEKPEALPLGAATMTPPRSLPNKCIYASPLSPQKFYRRHIRGMVPCVFRGMGVTWKASNWINRNSFEQRFGHEMYNVELIGFVCRHIIG